MLSLVSISSQVISLTTQEIIHFAILNFYSQKTQFKAIISFSKAHVHHVKITWLNMQFATMNSSSHNFMISYYNGNRDIILKTLPKY